MAVKKTPSRLRVEALLREAPLTFDELFARMEHFLSHAVALRRREHNLLRCERRSRSLGRPEGRRPQVPLHRAIYFGRRLSLKWMLQSMLYKHAVACDEQGRYRLMTKEDKVYAVTR